MRITLRQLSVFRSLYETHRVSASAARLHLSPSAVSQSLKELESALGARLFVRESKGLTPTPAALTLLPYATLLVDKADEVEALFAEAGEGRAGTLAVGANRRFGIYVLSRRLMHMKRRMPAIETSLMIEDNDVVEDAVAGHLIDVGFISGRPTNPDLDGFPCFEDRFAFVVGLGSPLMSAYVTARELSDATWVLEREQRTQRDVLAHLEARGIRIRHSVTMDTMGAVKRAAGTGLGVALLPYLSVREEILRGDLVEIMKPASTELADSQKIWAVCAGTPKARFAAPFSRPAASNRSPDGRPGRTRTKTAARKIRSGRFPRAEMRSPSVRVRQCPSCWCALRVSRSIQHITRAERTKVKWTITYQSSLSFSIVLMFMKILRRWIEEIATMLAATLFLRLPASILPSQPRRSESFSSRSSLETKFS